MKLRTKRVINHLLDRRGLVLVKQYEIKHLEEKYKELIKEIEEYFHNEISQLKKNEKRIELVSKLYGTGVFEAFYIIDSLKKTEKLIGDVCEFGIANGATSALIANEIRKTTKNLWLFDSFEGLSTPTKKDILINDIFGLKKMENYKGTMQYSNNEVKKRLKAITFPKKRVKIIKGFIEKTIIENVFPEKTSFAFVDFDLYQPITIALSFLDKTLVKGGIVIVDDYNFFSKGVSEAVDEFINKNREKYKFSLPKRFAGHFCIIEKIK